MSYLAITRQVNKSEGKPGAVKVIEHSINKNLWNSAGIYYPNTYHIDYAVSKAYTSGIKELEKAASEIAFHLKETQMPDGSFESRKWTNNKDVIQSTAYALHAMLDLKSMGISISDESIRRAFDFLLTKAQRENSSCTGKVGYIFLEVRFCEIY